LPGLEEFYLPAERVASGTPQFACPVRGGTAGRRLPSCLIPKVALTLFSSIKERERILRKDTGKYLMSLCSEKEDDFGNSGVM
jgi:hypothetical protein